MFSRPYCTHRELCLRFYNNIGGKYILRGLLEPGLPWEGGGGRRRGSAAGRREEGRRRGSGLVLIIVVVHHHHKVVVADGLVVIVCGLVGLLLAQDLVEEGGPGPGPGWGRGRGGRGLPSLNQNIIGRSLSCSLQQDFFYF